MMVLLIYKYQSFLCVDVKPASSVTKSHVVIATELCRFNKTLLMAYVRSELQSRYGTNLSQSKPK